ncbi:hypothetical protein LSAT2_012112 [Lamellibrachia satsuma]|nr:hypothetical protein LSAT2_012112 [Lamellibrachia satsuma]
MAPGKLEHSVDRYTGDTCTGGMTIVRGLLVLSLMCLLLCRMSLGEAEDTGGLSLIPGFRDKDVSGAASSRASGINMYRASLIPDFRDKDLSGPASSRASGIKMYRGQPHPGLQG